MINHVFDGCVTKAFLCTIWGKDAGKVLGLPFVKDFDVDGRWRTYDLDIDGRWEEGLEVGGVAKSLKNCGFVWVSLAKVSNKFRIFES